MGHESRPEARKSNNESKTLLTRAIFRAVKDSSTMEIYFNSNLDTKSTEVSYSISDGVAAIILHIYS